MTDPAEALSEAARLGILQGRFEALGRGVPEVEPAHLVIGLLQTLSADRIDALGLTHMQVAELCKALGAGPAAAPLSTGDIEYAPACHALVSAALAATAGPARAESVEPLHLLLGLHLTSAPADVLAGQLTRAGLTAERIRAALDRPGGLQR